MEKATQRDGHLGILSFGCVGGESSALISAFIACGMVAASVLTEGSILALVEGWLWPFSTPAQHRE